MWWRRILIFLLWVLSLVGISFFGGNISYGFFFAVTLLPVISLLYLLCVFFRFKIYQEIESRTVISGQSVPYYFVLQNDDYFAFSSVSVRMYETLSYVEELPKKKEFELLPREHFKYETNLVCRYRGEYEVGIRDVTVTDFLKIFRIRYPVRESIKAIVKPRLVEIERLQSVERLMKQQALPQRSQNSQRDSLVREYVPGDGKKEIHWKNTARRQQLMVREQIGEEEPGIGIYFEGVRLSKKREEYLPVENKILELVLALSLYWLKHQIGVEIFWKDQVERCSAETLEHFEAMYNQVADVTFEPQSFPEDRAQLLYLQDLIAKGFFLKKRVLFLILQREQEEVLQLADSLQLGGLGVVIYRVSGQGQTSPMWEGVSIPMQEIDAQSDLTKVL